MKLDLHQTKHEDVKNKVEEVLNHCLGSDMELVIITGNSERMKELVISSLLDYNIEYKIGDYLGINEGYITAYIE